MKSLSSIARRAVGSIFGLSIVSEQSMRNCLRLAEIVREREIKQLLYQQRLLGLVEGIDGDIVECGVGYGRSLLYWGLLAREEGMKRRIWGFDSFEGFPEATAEDSGVKNPEQGRWDVNVIEVVDLLTAVGFDVSLKHGRGDVPLAKDMQANIVLVKGFFNQSLRSYSGSQIALLHIDADLYNSYLDVLNELYPKVGNGGVIAFDEYHEPIKWPGAKRAVDQYFGDKVGSILTDRRTGKCYLVKENIS